MEEFLKMLLEAVKHGNVEVHTINCDEPVHADEPTTNKLKQIAALNKKLYEAHIQEGFTSEKALALTVAVITS